MLLLNDSQINDIIKRNTVYVRSMIMIPVFDLKQLNDDILNSKVISKINFKFNSWNNYGDVCPELDRIYSILASMLDDIFCSSENYEEKLSSLNSVDLIYDKKIIERYPRFCMKISSIFKKYSSRFKFVFKELLEQNVKEAYCLSTGLSEEFFDGHIKGLFFIDIMPTENINNFFCVERDVCKAFVACNELYRNIFMTKIFDGLFLKDVNLPDGSKIKMSSLCINLMFLSDRQNIDKILAYRIIDPTKADFMLHTNLYYEGIDANAEFSLEKDFNRLVSISDFMGEYAKDVSYIWDEKLLEEQNDNLLYLFQVASSKHFTKKAKVKSLSESFLCKSMIQYLPSNIIRNLGTKIFPMMDCYGSETEFRTVKDLPENNEVVLGSRCSSGRVNLILRMNKDSVKKFEFLLDQIRKKNRILYFRLSRANPSDVERRILVTSRPLTIGIYEDMIDRFIEEKFGVKSHLKHLRKYPISYYRTITNASGVMYDYEANLMHEDFLRLSKRDQEDHKKYCFYRMYLNDLIDDRNRCFSNLHEISFDSLTGIRHMLNTCELYHDKIIDVN